MTPLSSSYDPDNGYIVNIGDNGTTMQFNRRITDPGLYYITAVDNETVDNVTKVLHSDTIAIMADNRTAIDAKLQARWNGIKSGLANANAAEFLKNISIMSQGTYSDVFVQLTPVLPQVVVFFQANPIELVYMNNNIAQYSIDKDEIIDGQTVTVTYLIYFIKDMDGLWKIDRY